MHPEMKILVVDDFSTMRRIVKNLLKQNGYSNIKEAEDGAQAWWLLNQAKFDFVITDWNMPNLDGVDLTKKIKKEEELKHLPVLMVIAEAEKVKLFEAIHAGISNYIVKPFMGEELVEKINKILEKNSAKR